MTFDPRAFDADPLLAGLTAPQVAAVVHVDGPALVVAGPGSGKTRVITRRVAHLVQRAGVAPWEILAITFTNKAAEEMRNRTAQLLTERQARAVTLATFHSFCARVLRQYGERVGLPPGFSIWDMDDQKKAMKVALNALQFDPKNFPPASMLAAISNAKNALTLPEAYAKDAFGFHEKKIAEVYTKYQSLLSASKAADFDDLLMLTVKLLREHADVREALSARYRYILVDEYQDTNQAQFRIAELLAGHKNMMATGDPDQSIYGWRGADIRNILDFERVFPGAEIYRLEQNYRSFGHILKCADALIRHNQGRKHKELFTDRGDGEKVILAACADEQREAGLVVSRFRELHDERNIPWGQCACFYRTSSLSRALEDALRNAGVPYKVARGTAFYDREEVKNAVAYLRAVANPADDVVLSRIINVPARGISDKTLNELRALAPGAPLGQSIQNPRVFTQLGPRAAKAVDAFGRLLHGWRKMAGVGELTGVECHEPANLLSNPGKSLAEFVEEILRDSGLEDYYGKQDAAPDEERLANLSELVNSAKLFEDALQSDLAPLGDDPSNDPFGLPAVGGDSPPPAGPPSLAQKLMGFLEKISLVADSDAIATAPDSGGVVTLMTLHAAKGLEYDAVAVVGLEDGLLPHKRAVEKSGRDDEAMEEERRLLFVGITRARKFLMLTHAQNRSLFGQFGATIPSRFIRELPKENLEKIGPHGRDREPEEVETGPGELTNEPFHEDGDGKLRPGMRVRHKDFGIGKVASVMPMSGHTKVVVDFPTMGRKTLIAEYARLEVV